MALTLAGCSKKAPPSSAAPATVQTAERGRATYVAQCTACHNNDPKRPGAVGPEVFGASLPLLEARILRAEYPAGYKPKRTTHAMAALPHLKPELEALHAYLNDSK